MKIHTITHAPFETIGCIADWISKKKFSLTESEPYNGDPLPPPSAYDCLIVMGGPQSPLQTKESPYLLDEIAHIKQAIAKDKIVLGFCLGAQLIAEALDAKTEHSPEKEVGIFPIELTEEGKNCSLFDGFSEKFEVIHWHNDMPGIPKGAKLLAHSKGCPQQAFQWGNKVFGFQFHMEVTKQGIAELAKYCPEDLIPGKYIQTAKQMFAFDIKAINERMFRILDRICQGSRVGDSASNPAHSLSLTP